MRGQHAVPKGCILEPPKSKFGTSMRFQRCGMIYPSCSGTVGELSLCWTTGSGKLRRFTKNPGVMQPVRATICRKERIRIRGRRSRAERRIGCRVQDRSGDITGRDRIAEAALEADQAVDAWIERPVLGAQRPAEI